MKLYVLSDLHVEFSPFTPDPDTVKAADVIILAGDIYLGVKGITWARKTFPDKPVVYVAGNHEFYGFHWDKLLDQLREEARAQDVYYLENESVSINGVRFLGATLWTDFQFFGMSRRSKAMREVEWHLVDYSDIKAETIQPEVVSAILGTQDGKKGPVRWSPKLTAVHSLARHQASLAWLKSEFLQASKSGNSVNTVVVSHHYPHKNSTAPRYADDLVTAGYGSHLPLDMITQADLWIHGHTHDSFDYEVGDAQKSVRVVCNPRGYPLSRVTDQYENSNFNPKLLIDLNTYKLKALT